MYTHSIFIKWNVMYNNYQFDLQVLKIKHRKQSNNIHSNNWHTKYSKTGRQTDIRQVRWWLINELDLSLRV